MGNFNMVPGDITFDILTRLPAETVLECKLVSKSWNRVVGYPSFSQTHLDRCLKDLDSAGKFTFLLANCNLKGLAYKKFHYLEYVDENSSEKPPVHRLTRMKLNPAPFIYYLLAGSCNGLVFLTACNDNERVSYEPLYICNPITRECVVLPEFEVTYDRGSILASGFGHVSSSNEYKIVRMHNLWRTPAFSYVEVYTLGSGKGWRDIGKRLDKNLSLFISIHGVHVNGFIYWGLEDANILGFDLANEIFVEIPAAFPTCYWHFKLGVLGGYLSAFHYDEDSETSDLLLLKKKKDGSLNWVKEFTLRDTDTHMSLAVPSRGTVLCCSVTKVKIHDLNSSSTELLVEFDRAKHFNTIPHMNTLVSLKALGEENTKVMETVDVPSEEDEEPESTS